MKPSAPTRRGLLLGGTGLGTLAPYALSALRRAHGLPPGVHRLVIAHDGDCATLTGRGRCTCSPTVGQPRPV